MPVVLVDLLQSTGTKGGIEIYARELYRHIASADSAFTFIGFASSELAGSDHSWFPGEMIDSGISGENRLSWAWGELFSVGRAAKKVRADLIHGPAMFAPLQRCVPAVVTFHDLLYFSHPELMQTKLFTEPVKWMERRAASRATRIITISNYSASAIRRYFRYPDSHIDVIPLAGRNGSFGGSTGLQRSADLFLAVGQRSPYKDFGTVVRAWSFIDEAVRPRLVITGSHGEDPLIPLVEELGLAEWVDLRQWVPLDELELLFGTATALIDSTLATGFSMPTLEAMVVGLPVILADTEVFREVGASAADYFTAGDAVDLARAVTSLASDATRRAELESAGRARAAEFSWDRVAQATLLSFERALAESAARA